MTLTKLDKPIKIRPKEGFDENGIGYAIKILKTNLSKDSLDRTINEI